MVKQLIGIGFSLALCVSCSSGTNTNNTPASSCVETGKCVAANPTLTCCDSSKTLKADEANCPVAEGVVGGQPWSCQ